MTDIDFSKIAAGATVAADNELPPASGRPTRQPNPFVPLIKAALKDAKRRDLPGRYSLVPFEGRKTACEAYAVITKLKTAARQVGCTVQVRKLDPTAEDTALTFKVTK